MLQVELVGEPADHGVFLLGLRLEQVGQAPARLGGAGLVFRRCRDRPLGWFWP
ncbi:MAG TPA: hypothetical protein VHI11_12520 [Jiangellaceae bacterium]|nr:hypothetical protein [Jiangellaceae bacterium]